MINPITEANKKMSPDQMPRNSQRDAEDEPCKTVEQELIDSLNAQLTQANTKIDRLCEALTKAIKEADAWHDDGHGGSSPNLEAERALVKEIKDNE